VRTTAAALLVALTAVVAACGPSLTPTAGVSPGSSPVGPASGPRISAPPISPSPPGMNLPAFACADAHGGKTGVANVITARMSSETGFDRFVLQFDGIVPTYDVKRRASPVFSLGASGQKVTVQGTAGVLVTVHSATGVTTFTGSTDLVQASNPVLLEARQTEDFEGYVSWALGLSKPACMRVFTITEPARLIVDFEQPSS
jgi:hypothetical protein